MQGTYIRILMLTMYYFRYVHRINSFSSNDANIDVTEADIGFLEHVVITMSLSVHTDGRQYDYDDFNDEVNYYANDIDDLYEWLEDEHPRRGDIRIELTAPSGTKSVLLPYRNYDFINEYGYDNWPFMSVHFWGENPIGTWKLKTTYKSSSGYITLSNIKMTLYGTQQTPAIIANITSSGHSSCATPESETNTPESETNTPESETNTPESGTNSKTNPLPLAIGISGGIVGILSIIIAVVCVMIINFYRKKKERTIRFRRLQNIIET